MADPSARIHEHPFGLTWVVAEPARRTSHALATDAGVWLVDPVDLPEPMERVAALGTPAGVLQLIDRHNRDCAAVAQRLGVPHHRVPEALPGTPFDVVRVVDVPGWHEVALWWPDRGALVVAETLGTERVFTAGHGAVGMHPIVRALPPGGLRGMRPDHLLVGHGPPVSGTEAREGVEWAYAHARRDVPRLGLTLAKMLVRR